MDLNLLNLINLVYLVSFVVLVILAILRIAKRYLDYRKQKLPIPLLLHRDGFFLSGLSLPFLGILFFRAFNIAASTQWWYPLWLIGSNSFAVAGTAFWVYIEYFKIEK